MSDANAGALAPAADAAAPASQVEGAATAGPVTTEANSAGVGTADAAPLAGDLTPPPVGPADTAPLAGDLTPPPVGPADTDEAQAARIAATQQELDAVTIADLRTVLAAGDVELATAKQQLATAEESVASLTAWREKASTEFQAIRVAVAGVLPGADDGDVGPLDLVANLVEVVHDQFKTRDDLIAELRAQLKLAITPAGAAVAVEEPADPTDMVKVKVTEYGNRRGPTVTVNGKPYPMPVDQEVSIPRHVLEILKGAAVKFVVVAEEAVTAVEHGAEDLAEGIEKAGAKIADTVVKAL